MWPQFASETPHFFTVDVEEYFQVNAFEGLVNRDDWDLWPCRLDKSMSILLAELHRVGVRGTFFVLGWVADRNPKLVREIANAGHEIASHGYWHRRVPTMSPGEFREDLRASKRLLEDITGERVDGFRAPSFSITPGVEWAFDVLIEEGFRYDSSVFPIRRPGYGTPGAPRSPHVIRRAGGGILEIPLATAKVMGLSLPAAGGAYLRQLPFALTRRAFAQASALGLPATFYIHPWEIDAGQPRLQVDAVTHVRHYRGLTGTLDRIRRLLREFQFTNIRSFLDETTERKLALATAGG
jgi:polysaccharide deacetylase family protein (PEP-CTERM system associated)